jgi:hypothetical protein
MFNRIAQGSIVNDMSKQSTQPKDVSIKAMGLIALKIVGMTLLMMLMTVFFISAGVVTGKVLEYTVTIIECDLFNEKSADCIAWRGRQ